MVRPTAEATTEDAFKAGLEIDIILEKHNLPTNEFTNLVKGFGQIMWTELGLAQRNSLRDWYLSRREFYYGV